MKLLLSENRLRDVVSVLLYYEKQCAKHEQGSQQYWMKADFDERERMRDVFEALIKESRVKSKNTR